jgi:hypothetical protein
MQLTNGFFFASLYQATFVLTSCEPQKKTEWRRWQTLPFPLSLSLSLSPPLPPPLPPPPPLNGVAKQTQARELDQADMLFRTCGSRDTCGARRGVSTIPIHDMV